MTTKRQHVWRRLVLILAVLPCCMTLQVSIPELEYEVANGEDISLTCSFVPARPISNIFVLRWEAYPDDPEGTMKLVATYFLNNPMNIAPDYEGRATLEVNIDLGVSTLKLMKVSVQDSRRYQCSVMIPDDDEGTPAATTSLLVLVPPSPPICRIQGQVEYWHDITLTCKSEQGSPTPVTEWQTYSVENILRTFPPKTTEENGVLSLFNISREMSGFYICTSTNRIGSASCNLTLSVMPGSMNIGATAGIIGGVLAGVVFLGILVFCCCRKKGKKDKNVESSPGEVFYDRDAPEAGEEYRDDEPNTKQSYQYEDKDIVPQNSYNVGTARPKFEDDQHSYNSGKDKHDGKASDTESRQNNDHRNYYHGSRDRLDDERNHYSGSRDRLDDQRNRYGGSRDRLEDQRDRYGGSRDRLEDQRDRYGGSRDRLEDQRDRYGGSRDRLEDQRDRYGGSRDRLEDQRERYGGSRDRLEDQRDRYGGSRDRLDDQRERYGGSRDRLDDKRIRHGGSRDRLDDQRDRDDYSDHYRSSRDRLDYMDDQYRD